MDAVGVPAGCPERNVEFVTFIYQCFSHVSKMRASALEGFIIKKLR